MATRGFPHILRSIVTETVVFAAAAVGILAFAAPLVGWPLALSMFGNLVLMGVVVALAIYLRTRRAVALAIPIAPTKASIGDVTGSHASGTIEVQLPRHTESRSRRPTILDRVGRYFYQDRVKLRIEHDLEGEVNRRMAKIVLLGGSAETEMMVVLNALPKRKESNPVERGMVVWSVETAHHLPEPLDVHAYVAERMDRYGKEADERYGFGAR